MKYWYSAVERGFFPFPIDGAVEVSAPQHADLMRGQETSAVIVPDENGFPVLRYPDGLSIIQIKAALKSGVDSAAETERLRYITPGTGQAMTYQRKVEEAKQALADADPSAESYPLLATSVGIDGDNIAAVATVVLGMDAAWAQIGAAIEHIRLTAKKAIDDAADEATARAVVEQLAWPVIEVQP